MSVVATAEQHPQLTHIEVENGNASNSHFMIILFGTPAWGIFEKASKLTYARKLSWFRHYDKRFLNFKHAKRRRCLLKYIKSWHEFDILTGEIIRNNYQFLMTWNRFSWRICISLERITNHCLWISISNTEKCSLTQNFYRSWPCRKIITNGAPFFPVRHRKWCNNEVPLAEDLCTIDPYP